MTTLELRVRHDAPLRAGDLPIDAGVLRPDLLLAMSPAQLAGLSLIRANQTIVLSDLVQIRRRTSRQDRLVIDAVTPMLHGIARGMRSGELIISGQAGPGLGASMAGGSIRMTGSVGDDCGIGMRGGRIHIDGSAGDRLGGVLPGHAFGLRGGEIHVSGDVGWRCGDRMRRGIIMIGGRAAGELGFRMLAGSILVGDDPGADCGYELRHGSIIASQAPARLPGGFADTGQHRLGILTLMAADRGRDRQPGNGPLAELLKRMRPGLARRWVGDLAIGGRGELLVPAI